MFPFNNDPRNALGTLWCHDHRFDFTAQNVYKGLAFFYLCYDDLDSERRSPARPTRTRSGCPAASSTCP
jgi:hypothetical protein